MKETLLLKMFISVFSVILFCEVSFFCGYLFKKYKEEVNFQTKYEIKSEDVLKLALPKEIIMPAVNRTYKKEETVAFWDFIYDKNPEKYSATRFNFRREAEYKGKIILTTDGLPLSYKTVNSNPELYTIMDIERVKPEKNCNLDENGKFGCYDYWLSGHKRKNYWEKL